MCEQIGGPVDAALDLRFGRGCAPARAAGTRGSRAPSSADRARSSGTPARRRARPDPARSRRAPPWRSCPRPAARARRSCASSVVLPAPVGPSTTSSSSRADLEVDAVAAPGRAEALGDAAHGQKRRWPRVTGAGAPRPALARRHPRLTAAPPSRRRTPRPATHRGAAAASDPSACARRRVRAHDEPPARRVDVDVARAAEVLLGDEPDRAIGPSGVLVHVLAADAERRAGRIGARAATSSGTSSRICPLLRHEQRSAAGPGHLGRE